MDKFFAPYYLKFCWKKWGIVSFFTVCWFKCPQRTFAKCSGCKVPKTRRVNALRPHRQWTQHSHLPMRAVSALKVLKSQLRGSFRDIVLYLQHRSVFHFTPQEHIHAQTLHTHTQSVDIADHTSYFLCVNLSSFFQPFKTRPLMLPFLPCSYLFWYCCKNGFYVDSLQAAPLHSFTQWEVFKWLLLSGVTKKKQCIHKGNGFHLLVWILQQTCRFRAQAVMTMKTAAEHQCLSRVKALGFICWPSITVIPVFHHPYRNKPLL